MDARFTQPRTDAQFFDPAAPAPFHSCIFHHCKIRFFGNALEGAVRAKKERLARSGQPLIANARSRGRWSNP
jgi:hypothetical protein